MRESIAATNPAPVDSRRPARSWLQEAAAWVDRLPGPTWIAYLALVGAGALFWHLIPWARGSRPVGTIDPPSFYWAFLTPALLWIAGYLARGTAASFESFRSVLKVPPSEAEQLRHDLMTIPARRALLITAFAAILTAASFLWDPVTYTDGVPLLLIAGAFLIQTLLTAMLFLLVYWLVRQTVLVRRTLATSVTIDVFRPAPLHAFATLTARPGIVIRLLVAAGVPINPIAFTIEEFLIGTGPYVLVPSVIAVFAFVLPLTGAHARLVDQKELLQEGAELRLEAVLRDLNHDVDTRDLDRADQLNKTLSSLVLQRDILARLPTWPWSTATLRGLLSAILLPLALFVAQQVLSRFV